MILLFALLGALGVYWFVFRDAGMPPMENIPRELLGPESPIPIPEAKPVITVEKSPEILPPPPNEKEEPVKTSKPKIPSPEPRYYIQVATCSFDKCKEEFTGKLREAGQPVFQKRKKEKFDFIELISKQVYTLPRANYLVDMINRRNKGAGNASVVYQPNGHRITMGNFTALDHAKNVKFYLEKEMQSEELIFNLEHVRKDYQTSKIYAGPYRSKSAAQKVLKEFRRNNAFPEAFIVTN